MAAMLVGWMVLRKAETKAGLMAEKTVAMKVAKMATTTADKREV